MVAGHVLLLLISPCLLLAALLAAAIARAACDRLVDLWTRLALALLRVDVDVDDRGLAGAGPRPHVYVLLNQTSPIESLVIPRLVPPCTGFANIEFLLLPLVGWVTWARGAVVVIRQWPRSRRSALARAMQRLARGESIYISIEGRRSPTGALLPYRRGAVALARSRPAAIVPVYVHGALSVLPRGRLWARPGRVRVVALPAIAADEVAATEEATLLARLRAMAEAERARS